MHSGLIVFWLMIIFLSKRNYHCGNNLQGSPANHVGELLFTCDTWPDLAQVFKNAMAWTISGDLSARVCSHRYLFCLDFSNLQYFYSHHEITACLLWRLSCSFKTWSTFKGREQGELNPGQMQHVSVLTHKAFLNRIFSQEYSAYVKKTLYHPLVFFFK